MNIRSGSIKVYKVDKDNNNIVLGNIKFELYSEEEGKVIGTYTTDENGEIYIENIKTGKYKIIEKNTNKWYNLSNEVKVEVKWNELTEVKIENELKKGKVKITKVDKENKETKLEGVIFEVLDKSGNILEEIVTDKTGEAKTSSYAIRDYEKIYLKEKSTQPNYVLNDELIEIKLEENKESEITLENEYKKGNLKIYKVNKENHEEKIEGVKFEIYSKEENKLIGEYTTDKEGKIEIANLKIGKYKIVEKETNKWYNLSEDTEIEVKWNETAEITIEDELKKAKAKIVKVDSENEEIKIQGVEFNVLDEEGKILEKIKTDSKGEAETSLYAIRDNSTIYLKETKTNEKYVLNNELIKIELKEVDEQEIIVKNEKIKGQIKIIKQSEDDNKITNEKAGTPLQGVVFEIYNSEGKYIEQIITDKKGEAITSKLEKGEYKIKEIETNKWYKLNEEIINTQIKENNEIVEVKVTNESENPEVNVEKIGVDKAEVGSTIEYDISMKNIGNTKLNKLTWIDEIPYEYIHVTKFQTGTFNQNTNYDIYYKTNLSNDEYILLMEGLNSTQNYEINFELELADNEYITEIRLEFKEIEIGFSSNENLHLTAKIRDTVKSETTFINKAKVIGEYNGYEVENESNWKTFAYKLLPITGF